MAHRLSHPHPLFRLSFVTCLAVAGLGAHAADGEAPLDKPPSAVATAWEGAIGLNTQYRPEYQGAERNIFKVTPALFLRYGRFTITNASGFVTRRADDVVRGLGLDMVRNDKLRVNAALRFDAGRSEGSSGALAGVGDIKPTVRARFGATWQLEGPWRLGASWSIDAFGRGGGNFGDVNAAWDHRLGPATVMTLGGSVSVAGDRYMQTYYGISEAQAERTHYRVYEPSAGLRDIALFANLRHDIGHDWTILAGAGATRLLGPAADSPLTVRPFGWGVNAGAAWRF